MRGRGGGERLKVESNGAKLQAVVLRNSIRKINI